tara:strand:- start:322 stop:747 length:426 start_codon:yes stop_codon:yes gene_type:complete
MAEQNFTTSWKFSAGLNHAPAYQVSGAPYAKAAIDSLNGPGPAVVHFPYVTKWVQIINNDTSNAVKVAFSVRGLESENNYFTVGKGAAGIPVSTQVLDMKVTEVYLTGSVSVDIVAGLTSIKPQSAATTFGPNWSGSAGVG